MCVCVGGVSREKEVCVQARACPHVQMRTDMCYLTLSLAGSPVGLRASKGALSLKERETLNVCALPSDESRS